jgi:hypothetical protein
LRVRHLPPTTIFFSWLFFHSEAATTLLI